MSTYSRKYAEELMARAKYLATPGKGLLAADESTSRDNWEATGQHQC
jgi:fructose-bisphosphate aldolase class I